MMLNIDGKVVVITGTISGLAKQRRGRSGDP